MFLNSDGWEEMGMDEGRMRFTILSPYFISISLLPSLLLITQGMLTVRFSSLVPRAADVSLM